MREDEKGTLIVFWKTYLVDEGTENEHTAFALRYYKVFNADQCDGLNLPPLAEPPTRPQRLANCEAVLRAYLDNGGPRLVQGGARAYYSPRLDAMGLPPFAAFESAEEFYSTAWHEAVHSTGHASRLNRPDLLEDHYFGDESYSKEELVAEMGAAFLAGQTGIAAVTLPNSASYIAAWIKVLRGDSKLVVQAAAQAQKACDLILQVELGIDGNPKPKEAHTQTMPAPDTLSAPSLWPTDVQQPTLWEGLG